MKTPEGVGSVSGFSQLPGHWRIRVELDEGGYWIGSSLVVVDANDGSQELGADEKRGRPSK